MKEALTGILATIIVIWTIVFGLILLFDISVGLIEIAYWIITGDWFHFMSLEPAYASIF